MANEEKETGYTGFRFLLDAKDRRQYALYYKGGVVQRPIRVFLEDGTEGKLVAGEKIFALEDTAQITEGEATVPTMAVEISTEANPEKQDGMSIRVKTAPVTYEIIITKDDLGAPSLVYQLTAESLKDLDDQGFDRGTTVIGWTEPLSAKTLADLRSGKGLKFLSFLPQHPGKAEIARAKASPKDDFNGQTAPTTPPVRPRYKVTDAALESVIKQFCKDLTAQAAQGKLDPVVGRERETDQALKVLLRRKQSSLCFTGEAGVGKTAMFYAIAQRLVSDKTLPERLQNARVLELDLQAMNAGAKFRGQFEEKLKPLIDGLAEREGILKGQKIVLAIDEIHSQLTAGKAEGGTDSANLMKPFLTSRGISVMGTTTDDEYKQHIEKDGALGRRFEKMRLGQPGEEDTVAILKRLWPLTKADNGLTEDLTDEQIRYIVTMTNRYAPQEAQPSKGEKVMNTAAVSAQFAKRTTISRDDILDAVAQMSNLPAGFLSQSDDERFLKLETALPQEVLGQPDLQRVIDGLIGARSGLNDPNQPWGCFVFQGPTGVGKTEAAKALARYLFGTEDALIKLDMSEYAAEHSVARLIGAPPGYVGFEDSQPALTERIRQRPYSILLLDEIEKAHPNVFNTLLPILNDGKMTDNHGKTVLFNNVIVIMTTNAGAAKAASVLKGGGRMDFGSGPVSPEKTAAELNKIYAESRTIAAGGPFRPEMINRIEELGGFITFRPLTQMVIDSLIVREVKKAGDRLSADNGRNLKGVSLEVTEPVMQQLAKEGYNPAFGARRMRKVVREKINNPLGKWLMAHKAEVLAMVAEHGAIKLVIDSLETFAPKMVAAAPSNDNVATAPAAAPAKPKKVASPKL